MLLLIKKELKLNQDGRNKYICGKRILKKLAKSKNIEKIEIIAIIPVNTEVQRIVLLI